MPGPRQPHPVGRDAEPNLLLHRAPILSGTTAPRHTPRPARVGAMSDARGRGVDDALDRLAARSDAAAERLVLTRERALQEAMLASDVDGLDRLLHCRAAGRRP